MNSTVVGDDEEEKADGWIIVPSEIRFKTLIIIMTTWKWISVYFGCCCLFFHFGNRVKLCVYRERERAAGRESRREKKKPDADKVVTHILVTTTFSWDSMKSKKKKKNDFFVKGHCSKWMRRKRSIQERISWCLKISFLVDVSRMWLFFCRIESIQRSILIYSRKIFGRCDMISMYIVDRY